jgi:hypothetical protein
MDLKLAVSAIPELKAVEAELLIISTMMAYVTDKTLLKDALQEVKIMSGWSVSSIKESCQAVMEVIASVFQTIMTDFNEETGSDIDSISIKPFKARFDEEIEEQANLKAAAMYVMEIASRVALALNISVPASATTTIGKPRKSFGKAILSLVVEEKRSKKASQVDSDWLTEAILREDSDTVQKLALMDKKLTQTGSPDALRQFAAKFKMTDADLAKVILDVLDDARKQVYQSDSITNSVTFDFNAKERKITAVLKVRDDTNATMAFLSGK